MTKALRGALFSGLVLPGLGHVVLGSVVRGVLLMAGTLTSLFVIALGALRQAQSILERVMAGEMALSPDKILAAAQEATRHADSPALQRWAYVLIGCWLIGVLDAYRIGRRQDRASRRGPVA